MIRALPLAPDPAVPHLAKLLDPSVVAASMADVFGCPVRTAVPIKVKYRIGEHLRIVYDVHAGLRRTIVAVRSIQGDAAQPLESRPSSAAMRNPSAFVLPDLEASAWAFPHDRRLSDVETLFAPPPALACLLEHRWVSSRLAGYTPEKVVVVECLDATGCTIGFAKQYASGAEARDAFRLHRVLATGCAVEGLRLPRALGLNSAAHVVVTEAAGGRRCTEPSLATNPRVMARLGRAVARLHATPPPPWIARSSRVGAEAIRTAASLLARALPSRVDRLSSLAVRLVASPPADSLDVTLHGDLHLKNALIDEGQTWLIDLDQAARGPAEADLGSFAALLRSHAAAALLDRDTASRLEHAFLDGYAAVRPLPSAPAFERHVAAAILIERALRAVTRVRRPLLARFDAVLDEAFAALDKAGAP